MKTILQALWDEIPSAELLGIGLLENKLISRGLDGEELITAHVFATDEFRGALADCLYELATTSPNISEADKSINLPDRDIILKRANSIYADLGETDKISGVPTVRFGW